MKISKQEAIGRLNEIRLEQEKLFRTHFIEYDEEQHERADEVLLDYIGGADIREAFEAVKKGYGYCEWT